MVSFSKTRAITLHPASWGLESSKWGRNLCHSDLSTSIDIRMHGFPKWWMKDMGFRSDGCQRRDYKIGPLVCRCVALPYKSHKDMGFQSDGYQRRDYTIGPSRPVHVLSDKLKKVWIELTSPQKGSMDGQETQEYKKLRRAVKASEWWGGVEKWKLRAVTRFTNQCESGSL